MAPLRTTNPTAASWMLSNLPMKLLLVIDHKTMLSYTLTTQLIQTFFYFFIFFSFFLFFIHFLIRPTAVLEQIAVQVGQVYIRGVASRQYLCLNSCGRLYGSVSTSFNFSHLVQMLIVECPTRYTSCKCCKTPFIYTPQLIFLENWP